MDTFSINGNNSQLYKEYCKSTSSNYTIQNLVIGIHSAWYKKYSRHTLNTTNQLHLIRTIIIQPKQ